MGMDKERFPRPRIEEQANETVTKHFEQGFTTSLERVFDKFMHDKGCMCQNCVKKVVGDVNSWIAWACVNLDPEDYFWGVVVDDNGKLVIQAPIKYQPDIDE